jgi:DtxR family Mn-dependent transcriptional regulator
MLSPLITISITILTIALLHYLFWPEKGFYFRWRRSKQLTERVQIEDVLKHMHNCEMVGDRPSIVSISGALQIAAKDAAELVTKIEAAELAIHEEGRLKLTPNGRQSALQLLRAHRLYERYLADTTGFSEEEWHRRADQFEHHLSSSETDELAARLGHPTHDPHGDPIPSASGDMIVPGGMALTSAKIDHPMRIVHIEDEPEEIYAQIVAEELHPGMVLRIAETSSQSIRFWSESDEHILAPVVAANIHVLPVPDKRTADRVSGVRLDTLEPGQMGEVITISPACRGLERRRLLDLGILPGTMIRSEFVSPSGDPVAYRIRDALIALRKQQAKNIRIRKLENTP